MITKNIPILPFLAPVKLWGIVGYLNPFTNPKNALESVWRHKNGKSVFVFYSNGNKDVSRDECLIIVCVSRCIKG